ncbi:MAG: nucleotidyl transferase AbiEii/AbiGii toxin family protein [Candidatus Moranbacteria bacterium]|nr:nucleotidyl transferase AbiEii/AbiGii toxin family protein [Candidatus Moranbacteria bacterium]
MLTFDQLRVYYPANTVISAKNMLVEYIQHELLDSLFKQEQGRYLSFIGGTALRIVYGGSRFSEDLDFDNFGLSYEDFQGLADAVVDDMRLKGFTVEFRTIEKGAYHCYVKFPHILQESRLASDTEEKILVRIDTMEKKRFGMPIVYTLNRFDIYRNILVNPVDILLSQKLLAILGRKREKGRDFFDVSYLYGMTRPNFEYMEEMLGISREECIARILSRCETLDFSFLAKDVEPFLMDPSQSARVVDFKRFITEQFS